VSDPVRLGVTATRHPPDTRHPDDTLADTPPDTLADTLKRVNCHSWSVPAP